MTETHLNVPMNNRERQSMKFQSSRPSALNTKQNSSEIHMASNEGRSPSRQRGGTIINTPVSKKKVVVYFYSN